MDKIGFWQPQGTTFAAESTAPLLGSPSLGPWLVPSLSVVRLLGDGKSSSLCSSAFLSSVAAKSPSSSALMRAAGVTYSGTSFSAALSQIGHPNKIR